MPRNEPIFVPPCRAIEDFLRRKYTTTENRGITYLTAAVDDLAREIRGYLIGNTREPPAYKVVRFWLENVTPPEIEAACNEAAQAGYVLVDVVSDTGNQNKEIDQLILFFAHKGSRK